MAAVHEVPEVFRGPEARRGGEQRIRGGASPLLTAGDSGELDVGEAERCGLVSRVVPADELLTEAMSVASTIAQMSLSAARMAKEAVNQTMDNMGFYNALNACFTLHQLNHSHWAQVHENGFPVGLEEDGLPNWRTAPPIVPAVKDQVRAQD